MGADGVRYLKQRRILGPRLDRLSGRQVLIHARRPVAERICAREIDFFNALADLADGAGLPVRVVAASHANRAAAARDTRHLNVIMGAAGPLSGPHLLHACPTYLHGFWYFDPLGARHHSSLGHIPCDLSAVPPSEAAALVTRLRSALVVENRSKYPQPERGAVPLEQGSIAVFAQEPIPATEGQFHIDLVSLIQATIASAGGRRVYLKPHPRQQPALLERIRAFHDPARGVEVVEASVHDLLAACAFTVSQASAVAFEGFVHGKPAILAGVTDFAANAVTIPDPAAMPSAMDQVMRRDFDHARFLHWFLIGQCLEPDAPDFSARLAARIRATGFPL
ncbi:hypothetical protein HMH01_12255 [Halovulum dunhuangense]|uniref:Capsular polysaccharide biosynthesis protein n=1 Tax=Halovulum dunhuangense TaxID=1505036 RepID=A0A849L4E8_9RHOB|nr:hypothetical protein [Halovulum dunhuangense]NNU81209.1 hypothetical protein [Halovulum dunhuangense]